MQEIKERVAPILLAVAAVTAVGVLGYHFIEGWGYLDSLYMTVITLSTVGYGEPHQMDPPGRVFTIVFILCGIGVLTYALSTLTTFIVDGDLKTLLRRRRMETKIAKLSNHYILCGAGRTGRAIMSELQKTHRPFVVVEKDPAAVETLQNDGFLALQGDSTTDDALLLKAGIQKARGLFGALPTDPDNAFVAISAKELNPKIRIVCKVQSRGAFEKLRRSGADAVINPEFIGGLRMASEMLRPAVVGFLDSMLRAEGQAFRIEEVTVPENSPLQGKPVGSVKGAEGSCALILAVKLPQEKTYELNPNPSRAIAVGEVLVAMGTVEHLQALEKRVGVRD